MRFIKRDSPTIASDVGQRIARSTRHLGQYPRSGRIVPAFKLEGIREVIVQNHRVVYEHTSARVDVLTVVHGARRLGRRVLRQRRSSD